MKNTKKIVAVVLAASLTLAAGSALAENLPGNSVTMPPAISGQQNPQGQMPGNGMQG